MAGTQGSKGKFVSVPIEDRFWDKVDTSGNDCWLWQGAKHPRGYGAVFVGKKRLMAHRVSWMLTNGPIPDRLDVLHTCDTPLCVKPAHLWLGTHADNMRDREAKGRNVNHRGETHGMSKLTEADVRAIRGEYIPAGKPVGSRPWLAAKYGISVSTVDQILSRRTWKHVE